MTSFTLNTSGAVQFVDLPNGSQDLAVTWGHLSPFAQGYVEAMLRGVLVERELNRRGETVHEQDARFSDLAPSTLAAILKDCEAFAALFGKRSSPLTAGEGGAFWRRRQKRGNSVLQLRFPPLTISLGDDGNVYAEARS